MAWSIQTTGTSAQVTTAVNATLPGNDPSEAASLALAQTLIIAEMAIFPATTPFFRVQAFGHRNGDGSVFRIQVDPIFNITSFGAPFDGSLKYPP